MPCLEHRSGRGASLTTTKIFQSFRAQCVRGADDSTCIGALSIEVFDFADDGYRSEPRGGLADEDFFRSRIEKGFGRHALDRLDLTRGGEIETKHADILQRWRVVGLGDRLDVAGVGRAMGSCRAGAKKTAGSGGWRGLVSVA